MCTRKMQYSCKDPTSTSSTNAKKILIINALKGKSKISLVRINRAKALFNSRKKYDLVFLRETQHVEELMKTKASLEGCTKEQIQ